MIEEARKITVTQISTNSSLVLETLDKNRIRLTVTEPGKGPQTDPGEVRASVTLTYSSQNELMKALKDLMQFNGPPPTGGRLDI